MTPEEQRRYDAWFTTVKPLLEAAEWAQAMKTVPHLDLEPARPRSLAKPLQEATIALVTSAGIATADQPPFDGPNIEGDYSIRVIDVRTAPADLRIYHTHFDTSAALEDINVVYPIDRLRDLEREGFIGHVAPRAVSFMGYFSNVFRFRDEVTPAVVDAVRATNADAALLVPV